MSNSDSDSRTGRRRPRKSGLFRNRGKRAEREERPQDYEDAGDTPSPEQQAEAADEHSNGDAGVFSRKENTPRTARRAAPRSGIDPVSRFSASALRRVSVLGDRPNQMVNSLAEQSLRRRGSVVLATLLSLSGVALLALLAVLVYQLVFLSSGHETEGTGKIVDPPSGHPTLVPDMYQGDGSGKELFTPIEERGDEATPLTDKEVFGSDTEELELDDRTLTLQDSEVGDTCTAMVWGEELQQALVDGTCTSSARGVYQNPDGDYVTQFTLFDLAGAASAGEVAAELDPTNQETDPGFVLPLNQEIEGLNSGYSQATTQVMGHYLAVFWTARADGEEPGDGEALATFNVLTMDAAVSVYEELSRVKEAQS